MNRAASHRKALYAAIMATKASKKALVEPDAVIEAAKDPQNVLHGEFDWNDEIAGHKYRQAQARSLIREVTFEVIRGEPRMISEISFVHHPSSRGQGYTQLVEIGRSRKLTVAVHLAECQRILGCIERAEQIDGALAAEEIWASARLEVERVKELLLSELQPARRRVAGAGREGARLAAR